MTKGYHYLLGLAFFLIPVEELWPQDTIPFTLISNRPIVEVKINGRAYANFCIDLGATGIGRVDDSLVEELELSCSLRCAVAYGPKQRVHTLHNRYESWAKRCHLNASREMTPFCS